MVDLRRSTFLTSLVDGRDVVEVDAELASGTGRPSAVFEGDFVAGVVDGIAVLEGF